MQTFGSYQLDELLGQGAAGAVYRAYDAPHSRTVAIKIYETSGDNERLIATAQTVARWQHPNIVQIFDAGVQDMLPFVVMEWVAGGTLAGRLAGGPLALDPALRLALALAEALAYAHARGVPHGNLTPANVLLRTNGAPVLTDFAPPAAAPSDAPADACADIFALGALLFQMIAGRTSDGTATLRSIDPALPAALDRLVQRMLAPDPAHRPQRMALVAAALREMQADAPATGTTIPLSPLVPPAPPAPPAPRPPITVWRWLLVVVIVLSALVRLALRPAANLPPTFQPLLPTRQLTSAELTLADAPLMADAQRAGTAAEPFSVGGVSSAVVGTALWFFGEVRNDGKAARESIEVRVSLLDATGAELASQTGYADRSYLDPGEASAFSVLFSAQDKPPQFARYLVQVRSRRADFQPGYTLRAFSVAGALVQRDQYNFLTVAGRVVNTGDQRAQFVKVYAVFYDAAGRVVGATNTFAQPENDKLLAAGASAFFAIQVYTLTGTPTRYQLYAEGSRVTP